MVKWIGGIIDRVLVVLGAICFAQAPHFFHVYTQRLGGHMEELRLQVLSMSQTAARSGKGLSEYIQKFLDFNDADIIAQGELMQASLQRFEALSSAYQSLIHATPLTRPFLFVRHLQLDIARMTLGDFQLGFPFSLEAGAYAIIGMAVGYAFFSLLKALFSGVARGSLKEY